MIINATGSKGGGSTPVINPLSVTENGTYTAPSGVDGYSPVTVNVSGGGGSNAEDGIIDGSISGAYVNNRVALIKQYKFESCAQLTSVTFQEVLSIGTSAFANCTRLTDANFQKATSVGVNAFLSCTNLETISFPKATFIGGGAFSACYKLRAAIFPEVTSARGAFSYCSSLSIASFPKLSIIPSSMFWNASKLATASFPSATSIGSYAFYACTSLASVDFSKATTVGTSAFDGCRDLSFARLPVIRSMGKEAFARCYNLLSLYLNSVSSVPTLSTNVFISNPIGGYTASTGGVYGSIFVPASLYASFQTATNWASISARLVSV